MEPRTLGHYRLEDLLGKGGMGEVYRAVDTRLDRKVAIKILPEAVAREAGHRQRLEREARAISGLNHPHICTLYDVGHEDGVDFLVMELLEGDTLAERISRGPMKGDEFLETALQITDALNAAHRAGLVHRDLKPGNVMLTPSGAKLLDFGLARIAHDTEISALTSAPTMTSPLTAAGTLVGTFQYLAPELLEGGTADARSDIFALGIVLYEMFTGQRAFEARTQAGLIGAILEREPTSISAIIPDAPPALENLIRACLAKNPDQRIQTAHDVKLQLGWIRDGGSAVGLPVAQARGRKRMARLAWALAAGFAVLSAVLGYVLLSAEEPRPPRIVASLILDADQRLTPGTGLAMSPDGEWLLYRSEVASGDRPYHLRRLADGEVRRVPGIEGAYLPFWSPDGNSLGFMLTGNRVVRVDRSGGNRQLIVELDEPAGASWAPDGTIVVGSWNPENGLTRVPASGGEPTRIEFADPSAADTAFTWPTFLPDGEHLLVSGWSDDYENQDIRVVSLDGRVHRTLFATDSQASYARGHVLYVDEGTLFARPFDTGRLTVGEPFAVHSPVAMVPWDDHAEFTVSATGLVVLGEWDIQRTTRLVVYDRAGAIVRERALPTYATDLDLSPDDSRLAMARPLRVDSNDGSDVWSYDLERDVFTRVTFEPGCDDPVWSPDGRAIAFSRTGDLARVAASGVGGVTTLVEAHEDAVPHDWSRDGSTIVYCVTDVGNDDLWAFDVTGDRGAYPILDSPFIERQGQLSPDGRWLAYSSDESGRRQVYLLSWPALDEKLQISREGGVMPRFARSGDELYFIGLDAAVMVATLEPAGASLRVSNPERLFATGIATRSRTHEWDVDAAGERFYAVEDASDGLEAPGLRLIVNALEGH